MRVPSELGYQERIDALNAALHCVMEAAGRNAPLPKLVYGALDTWDGVKANLMGLCSDLWEAQRRTVPEGTMRDEIRTLRREIKHLRAWAVAVLQEIENTGDYDWWHHAKDDYEASAGDDYQAARAAEEESTAFR